MESGMKHDMGDISGYFDLFGYVVRDRITGIQGVATSICFDLYGCVQAIVSPKANEQGEVKESKWFDISRLDRISDEPVMLPLFGSSLPVHGPQEKPSRQDGPAR